MNTVKKVTSELSTDFGSYIGRLTLILKVIILNILFVNKVLYKIIVIYILIFRNLIMMDFIEIIIFGL